ncbi:cathepsin L1 [Anabrus simplex]|uniref:cathepsin L1 n=1 Tax=Anabrus simplex TaxID=316456 RepID=UPI0035A3D1C9
MKIFLVLSAIIAISQALTYSALVRQEWHSFKLQHDKKYSSTAEEEFRMKVYMENRELIAEHNARYAMKEVTFSMAMNEFGDLLHDEFVKMMNGYNSTHAEEMGKKGTPYVSQPNVKAPASADWTSTGAVSAIKNQGSCGSCWAFSATGAIEGQHFRATGQAVSLSEQNLIDCTTQYGNNGCYGGVFQSAFQYVIDNGGIDSESSYPYEAQQDGCRYSPQYSAATISTYVNIARGDEGQLTEAVGTIGPVSVAIDGSLQSFQFYSGGIYYDTACSSSNTNHAVLVVGYGTTSDGYAYWTLKNSWGTTWGQSGYFFLYRNYNNQCGVATAASYPVV